MHPRVIIATVLLLFVIAGCQQIRDPDLPDTEPPPAEPVLEAVTLAFPSAVRDLVVDGDGNGVLERIAISYRPAGQAEVTASDAGSGETSLDFGESEELDLPAGEYEFESWGFGADPDTALAYGLSAVSIDEGTGALDLGLQGIIAAVDLEPETPGMVVRPGESLTLNLHVRSVQEGLRIAAGSYEVAYEPDSVLGSITDESDSSVTVQISESAVGDLTVTAVVTGVVLVDGLPEDDAQLTAEFTYPLASAEDRSAPELLFDPIQPDSGELTGSITDADDLIWLRIYEGNDLLGSSLVTDEASAEAAIEGAGEVTWSMPWAPTGEVHMLRAVVSDGSGNTATKFRSVAVEPQDEDVLEEYQTVRGAMNGERETFGMESGHCAVNEFSTPGQGLQAVGAGLQAVGAIGGLFMADTSEFTDRLMTTAGVAEQLRFAVPGQILEPITVLVVDDFGRNYNYELPAELLEGDLSVDELELLAADGRITHGAIVLHQTLEMFAALGFELVGPPDEPEFNRYELSSTEDDAVEFRVVAINIHDKSTVATETVDDYSIPFVIREAIENQSTMNIVVNMSFVMLPCSVSADLESSGIHTFNDYLVALADVNGVEVEQVVDLTTDMVDDPLLDYLNCPFGQGTSCEETYGIVDALTHVAAAGNFGSGFPLYPAAAPNAVAVSSMDAGSNGSDRSDFSNLGSVMAPGALFELANSGGTTIAYAGTSFAAPVVSVFSALDLAGASGCVHIAANEDMVYPPILANDSMPDTPFLSAIEALCTGYGGL